MVNRRGANMLRSSKKRFEVERVICRRYRRTKVEYYVKWKGYSSLANTWEPEENLNAAAIRAYNNPQPSLEAIEEGRDFLLCGIQKQLQSRSTVPTVISFRRDVFHYLFNGKGKPSNDRNSLLLERNDFNHFRNFPNNWDKIVDNIGDGLKIDFPIKLRSFLSWGPQTHTAFDGKFIPCPRYRPEKLSISIRKEAFTLSIEY